MQNSKPVKGNPKPKKQQENTNKQKRKAKEETNLTVTEEDEIKKVDLLIKGTYAFGKKLVE